MDLPRFAKYEPASNAFSMGGDALLLCNFEHFCSNRLICFPQGNPDRLPVKKSGSCAHIATQNLPFRSARRLEHRNEGLRGYEQPLSRRPFPMRRSCKSSRGRLRLSFVVLIKPIGRELTSGLDERGVHLNAAEVLE